MLNKYDVDYVYSMLTTGPRYYIFVWRGWKILFSGERLEASVRSKQAHNADLEEILDILGYQIIYKRIPRTGSLPTKYVAKHIRPCLIDKYPRQKYKKLKPEDLVLVKDPWEKYSGGRHKRSELFQVMSVQDYEIRLAYLPSSRWFSPITYYAAPVHPSLIQRTNHD